MRPMMHWLLSLAILVLAEVSSAQNYCGDAVYNDTQGSIYSPRSFVGQYRPFSNCTYSIKALKLSSISLTFQLLDVEFQANCSYDWVQVGCASHQVELPRRICGQNTSSESIIFSPCTDVQIDFHSDSSVNGAGFSIDYAVDEIECIGNCTPLSNPYGYICPCDRSQPNVSLPTARPSPSCPSDCMLSSDLTFCICPRPSQASSTPLTCPPDCYPSTDFFGDPTCKCDASTTPTSTTCQPGCYRTTDWLGFPYCNCPSTSSSPLLCPYGCYADADYFGNSFCNCPASTQAPIWCSPPCTSAIDANGNSYCNCPTTTLPPCFLPCYYSYDYDLGGTYCYCPTTTTTTNAPPTGCNQTLTASSGTVMSPNYPNAYTKGIDCTQMILVPMATSIKLRLIDLNIYYYDAYACSFEYIEITGCDGSYNVFCASSTFPMTGLVFQCTDSSLVIINFHTSTNSYYYRGFKLSYSANFGFNCSSDSSLYLNGGGMGILTSPNFPSNFPSYSECYTYVLTADDNVRIQVTFEQLKLEESSNCEKVSLKLTCQDESPSVATDSMREICGSSNPLPFTLDCRVLQIWFRSNATNTMSPRGFKMRYYGIAKQTSTVGAWKPTDAMEKSGLPQSYKIGIGLGVGVGGFFLLILIVIIIVLIVGNQRQAARRDRRHLEDMAVVWRNPSSGGGFVNPIHEAHQNSSENLPTYHSATGGLAETGLVGGFTAEEPKSKLMD